MPYMYALYVCLQTTADLVVCFGAAAMTLNVLVVYLDNAGLFCHRNGSLLP